MINQCGLSGTQLIVWSGNLLPTFFPKELLVFHNPDSHIQGRKSQPFQWNHGLWVLSLCPKRREMSRFLLGLLHLATWRRESLVQRGIARPQQVPPGPSVPWSAGAQPAVLCPSVHISGILRVTELRGSNIYSVIKKLLIYSLDDNIISKSIVQLFS